MNSLDERMKNEGKNPAAAAASKDNDLQAATAVWSAVNAKLCRRSSLAASANGGGAREGGGGRAVRGGSGGGGMLKEGRAQINNNNVTTLLDSASVDGLSIVKLS